MGLLSQGKPMNWAETKKHAKFVQERGLAQFVNIYNKSKDRADGPFKWGDEVEYILVKFDHTNKTARVSLRALDVFRKLDDQQKAGRTGELAHWNPEFAAYMVEGTPGNPFGVDGNLASSLCEIEGSMNSRRLEVLCVLEPDETVMSITNFPRLGCHAFTHPIHHPRSEASVSGSIFFPDEAIFGGHPRFKTLAKNIRARRRRKVVINLPIYPDTNTPNPYIERYEDEEAKKAVKPNHIYMDAMGFGMGCCCLQMTFQATHVEEAKVLYDQLVPFAPIALALSAASPIYRGVLTDRDCRWEVIACAVDDRTREEMGETEVLKESRFRIPKSRYDSVSTYISKHGQKYNDIPLVYNRDYYETLVSKSVDPSIARHIAHLFIRDPITLYKEKLDQTDEELDHFENIQSTNWQTVRFKPPPFVGSPIGWRVEFRPMEAQTTDFENAAYVVFITLLTRIILVYKLNFLMPLSQVDENMTESQKRDAIRASKFWFRRDITRQSSCKEPFSTVLENSHSTQGNNTMTTSQLDNNNSVGGQNGSRCWIFNRRNITNHRTVNGTLINASSRECDKDVVNCASRMTVNEIINGSNSFVGIMPIMLHYVDSLNDGSNLEQISTIKKYLKLISDRASLKIKTTARFMRDFVDSHPGYKHDSQVNDEINYDLLNLMDKIGKGELVCPDLIGNIDKHFESNGRSTNNIRNFH